MTNSLIVHLIGNHPYRLMSYIFSVSFALSVWTVNALEYYFHILGWNI